MSTKADRLLQVLEAIGIPDRIGFIGGIRGRVAGMLVEAARTKERAVMNALVLEALDLAYALIPPAAVDAPPPHEGPGG